MAGTLKPKRKLRLWEALALSLGLVGPTLAMSGNAQGLIDTVGTALPVVFLLGLAGVSMIAYGFIRLTQHFNHTGSAYGLVGVTIGPRAGFFAGFALVGTYLCFSIGTLSALGAFFNAFLAALSPNDPDPLQVPWIVTALIGAGLCWALNNRDGKVISRVLMAIEGLGIVLMLVLAAVILAKGGAPAGDAPRAGLFSLNHVSFGAVMSGVVAAFLSWAGFEACATLGEETDNPRRDIPLALFGSVLLTGVLFVLMMYVQTIGFGTDAAGQEAFKGSANSLGTLSQAYVGNAFGLAFLFTAVMSAFACHLSASATAARLLYALARDGFGPAALARLHPSHGQPKAALAVMFGLCALVNLLSWASGKPEMGTGNPAIDSYFYFAVIGSVCLMFTYLMVQLGVIRLIVSGRTNIRGWEAIFPLLGIAVMLVAIFYNFLGQASLASPPVVASAWCVLGLVIILLSPALTRRIGASLSSEYAPDPAAANPAE